MYVEYFLYFVLLNKFYIPDVQILHMTNYYQVLV